MNKRQTVVLLVASLALFVNGARADDPVETESLDAPRLLVVWHDAHRLYPGQHDGVAREVASLFAALELEMHWQAAERYDPPLDEKTILLRIVLMPSDPSGPGWDLPGDAMGAVLPGNGRARSVYVFYNTLVRGLKIKAKAGRLPDFNERKLLEKALGRVVAHEMIHAVAPSVRHAKRGLMRPSVTRSLLAGDDMVVPEPLRRAFLSGVERLLSTTSVSVASRAVDHVVPRAVRHAAGGIRLAPDDAELDTDAQRERSQR